MTESLRRNENETKTKTIYPAVIGRQLNCFFPRPVTAGYIVFVSFSFRFRFVSSQTFRHFVIRTTIVPEVPSSVRGDFGRYSSIWGDFGFGTLPKLKTHLVEKLRGWYGTLFNPSLRFDYPLKPPNTASRPIRDVATRCNVH